MTTVRQLSLFLENSPGRLARVARALADAGVDLVALSLAEAEQYGVARLIASDARRAAGVLEAAGFSVRETEVVAARAPDRPGGLSRALEAAAGAGLNVQYLYAFPLRRGTDAALVFRFDRPREAAGVLREAGIALVSEEDLAGPAWTDGSPCCPCPVT